MKFKDALTRMFVSAEWKTWKDRQDASKRKTAEELHAMVFQTGQASFWSKTEQLVSLLTPAMAMVRSLETDAPTSHLVWMMATEVCDCNALFLFVKE